MDRTELAAQIYNIAHLTGHFTLRSGNTSDHYFDKYLFESNPTILAAIADQLAPLIPAGTEILAGLEVGGIPIATALALKTGIPAVFVRKKAKEYGTCKLAEGTDIAGKRVCIIEDVVTTGGQILLSAEDLKKYDARVESVVSVIAREPIGRTNLANANLLFRSLFRMEELLPV
ncbi:orotate phosphoribosyltransferase [Paenibacillus cellulosilyticus]|uniref:Orotate phosphoribosyltransferase n=1 Tax=Paenibacillus cellulosilyticus TaxID=375489 RepID=A0A2V2YUX0_9BACL|nr:orotate phosphoribosyltransferase [Paenibacillus cellulosilyticus]PWW04895.1 orotate phosphoribosyltransferase [Paenibacillus cellulosilyticus]QKS46000.1 orotate phosphoribosyltransferase [Paenibacillus cellulosilyticus]